MTTRSHTKQNRKRIRNLMVPIVLLLIFIGSAMVFTGAQAEEPRTRSDSEAYDGYTLFNPNGAKKTYLVDMDGETVHTWDNSESGGYSVYLLENGNILRPAKDDDAQLNGGASAGLLQEIDWDGNVVWEYEYSSSTYLTHHDIELLPNGNILLIAWEVKSASEATAAGRSKDEEIWPDHIIEVKPEGSDDGEIVWEWHAWDHLIQDHDDTKDNYGVVSDHPELLDVNLDGKSSRAPPGGGGNDWLHINGISYNPERDQIVISSHFMNEFYVIDHSTTTEEAAGHTGGDSGKGGDILYRWGDPENYGAGDSGDQEFDVIHCSVWIPEGYPGAGNILVFDNGEADKESRIAEITPPMDGDGNYVLSPGEAYGPDSLSWSYSDGTDFYSNHLGSNQRLPNGNTLISESTSGYLFEVDSDGNNVWDFTHENEIARSLRYASDYEGLKALWPNEAPSASAGDDQEITPETEVTLDGSASSDSEDDTSELVFHWNVSASNPEAVTLSDESTAQPTFTAPDVLGDYLFTLAVQDTEGAWSTEDEVTITIVSPARPTVDAGVNQQALFDDLVTLDGSGCSDEKDDISELVFDWNVSAGNPSEITLSDETSISPTFTAPKAAGNYFFTLVVQNTQGLWSGEGEVRVTIISTGEDLTPHDPILIDGNDDFIYDNGVTRGSGTLEEPYVIEGWTINASTAHGIEIKDTDAFFIIVNNLIQNDGATGSYCGIRMDEVTHGTIEQTYITDNRWSGISLSFSSSNTVQDNLLQNNSDGIDLYYASGNTIENNDISNSSSGLLLEASSKNNLIHNNTITSNELGIYMVGYEGSVVENIVSHNTLTNNKGAIDLEWNCDSNTITNNFIGSNLEHGVYVGYSSKNIIVNNILQDRNYSLNLYKSSFTTVRNNTFTNGGMVISGSGLDHYFHTIDQLNLIDDKPIYYYSNMTGVDIDGVVAGQIFLVNCKSSTITSVEVSNTEQAIMLAYSENIEVTDSDLNNNRYGLYLTASKTNTLSNNSMANNEYGIWLSAASNTNSISYNQIQSNSVAGIKLLSSSQDNEVHFNNFTENGEGIEVDASTSQVDATENWWGSDSGPYHTSLNSEGTGDIVSDNVLFTPWTGKEEPANQLPLASAEADPLTGATPLAVSFKATGSDADGTIISYDWDFDDGTTATGQYLNHSFETAGTYTVTLTVTDDDGATATADLTITVTEADDDDGDSPAPGFSEILVMVALASVFFCFQKRRNGGSE